MPPYPFAASNETFGEAAVKACGIWKFPPAMLNGKPIECTINLPMTFCPNGYENKIDWRWKVAPEPALPLYTVTIAAQ